MPAVADRGGQSLDLVNVIFGDELPLLILQARSLARYAEPASINEILVIVNDPDQAACQQAVEAMRGEYGRFAERLRIVAPEQLLDRPEGVAARLRAAWVAGGRTRFKHLLRGRRHTTRRANPAGWCGNNGWSMQQAFKLLSVRCSTASHLLFLDAKNHFLQAMDITHYVAADGRARTRALQPDAKQRGWIDASFATLDLPVPTSDRAPPTVTPFAISRAALSRCTEELSARLGPLESHFALRRGQATEFMLMYAALDRGTGRWWELFASGLPESTTLYRATGEAAPENAAMLQTLRSLRRQPSRVAGIHRTRLRDLTGDNRRELLGLWQDHGLIRDAGEFDAWFPAQPGA